MKDNLDKDTFLMVDCVRLYLCNLDHCVCIYQHQPVRGNQLYSNWGCLHKTNYIIYKLDAFIHQKEKVYQLSIHKALFSNTFALPD